MVEAIETGGGGEGVLATGRTRARIAEYITGFEPELWARPAEESEHCFSGGAVVR